MLVKNKAEPRTKPIFAIFDPITFEIAISAEPLSAELILINNSGADVAKEIAGSEDGVDLKPTPSMGAEDFSYMLQERPGCYIWAGNGDSAGLHHPEYDFNDQLLAVGASYWSRLVEQRLPRNM